MMWCNLCRKKLSTRNKCTASSNKCLTTSNKKNFNRIVMQLDDVMFFLICASVQQLVRSQPRRKSLQRATTKRIWIGESTRNLSFPQYTKHEHSLRCTCFRNWCDCGSLQLVWSGLQDSESARASRSSEAFGLAEASSPYSVRNSGS